jgi:hypothetical protein
MCHVILPQYGSVSFYITLLGLTLPNRYNRYMRFFTDFGAYLYILIPFSSNLTSFDSQIYSNPSRHLPESKYFQI